MRPGSPFRHSWRDRTEFQLPTEFRGKTFWLGFDGVTYRANVWMNGGQIATADKLACTAASSSTSPLLPGRAK